MLVSRRRQLVSTLTVVTLLLPLFTASESQTAFAASKPPTGTCKPLGTSKIVSGKKYTCTKVKTKLVWNGGVFTDVFLRANLIRPTSAAQVSSLAISNFNEYTTASRSPQTVVVEAQPGISQTWIEWVSKGATLIAKSFDLKKTDGTYVAVLAKDRQWFVETYTRLFDSQVAESRARAFDAGAPAFGGKDTGSWNFATIEKNNLEANDPTGMRQTPAHEYFHAIQETTVGYCGACGVPQWFWEGAAVFVGTAAAAQLGFNSYEQQGRPFAINRTINGPTAKLTLSQVTENNASMDPYGIGSIATEYLVANVGMTKFLNVYKEVGAGKSFSAAFQAATGIALSDFYIAFETSRSTLGAPRN